MGLEASVVIPVHNEEQLLHANTLALIKYLSANLQSYEVVLVENGSLDHSSAIAKHLADTLDHVCVVHLPQPSLGEALKEGVLKAKYNNVIYFPIDLSVNLGFIKLGVERLDEFDVVVGSKRMERGLDRRPYHRRLLSECFHCLVRGLFRTSLTDTTCVKAFRRDRVLGVFKEVPSCSQVFETEMLLAAQRLGLKLLELPVEVNDSRPSRQPLVFKVRSKLRDLFSLRVDSFAFWFGGAATIIGLALLVTLGYEKLMSGQPGFLNPYSFLIAMLLVVSGFQIIVFGLQANLLLQVRRSVEVSLSPCNKIGEKEEE
jgi:hypothetical protein